jgi:hypothetical protein
MCGERPDEEAGTVVLEVVALTVVGDAVVEGALLDAGGLTAVVDDALLDVGLVVVGDGLLDVGGLTVVAGELIESGGPLEVGSVGAVTAVVPVAVGLTSNQSITRSRFSFGPLESLTNATATSCSPGDASTVNE